MLSLYEQQSFLNETRRHILNYSDVKTEKLEREFASLSDDDTLNRLISDCSAQNRIIQFDDLLRIARDADYADPVSRTLVVLVCHFIEKHSEIQSGIKKFNRVKFKEITLEYVRRGDT